MWRPHLQQKEKNKVRNSRGNVSCRNPLKRVGADKVPSEWLQPPLFCSHKQNIKLMMQFLQFFTKISVYVVV